MQTVLTDLAPTLYEMRHAAQEAIRNADHSKWFNLTILIDRRDTLDRTIKAAGLSPVCPACDNTVSSVWDGDVWLCMKCGALHGETLAGEQPAGTAICRCEDGSKNQAPFDFMLTTPDGGVTRTHGWFHRKLTCLGATQFG